VHAISEVLADVDIGSRLNVEKQLDAVGEEIVELKRRVDNSLALNNFNLTASKKGLI